MKYNAYRRLFWVAMVPLCSKSLDMAGLAEQGKHYNAGNIKIIYSDMFKVSAQTFAECMGGVPPHQPDRLA